MFNTKKLCIYGTNIIDETQAIFHISGITQTPRISLVTAAGHAYVIRTKHMGKCFVGLGFIYSVGLYS